MYHAHFGLQKRLFDEGVAADAAVFRNRQHTELVEQLKLAFAATTSVVVLRGPAGVGKSTLTSAALRASSTRLALAWLNGTPTNAAELLELMLVELGVNTARTSRIERLQLWRQFQSEMAATESRLFVVVERTEDLPVEVLHALDSSTAADAAGHPGANVVLLGHGRIDEHLADPVLDSFRQRIRLRAELKPFTEAELQDYLRHRVTVAGGHYDRVFAPGTVAALQRYSGGITRLANNLCETALTLAASRGQKVLTAELVGEAAVTWLGLSELQPVAVPPVANTTPVTAAKPATPAAAAPLVAPIVFNVPRAPVAPPITVTVAAPIALAPVAPSVVAASRAPVAGAAPLVPPTPVAVAAPAPPARPSVATAPVTPPRPAAPAAAAPTTVSRAPAAPTVVSAPLAPPAAGLAPIASAIPPRPAARPMPPPIAEEFDGGETDIPDVSIVDFPVLTDAIDLVEPDAPEPAPIVAAAPAKPTPKAPGAPAGATPAPPPRAATPLPPAVRPTPPSVAPAAPPRVETAYAAQRTAPPTNQATPAPPAPRPAAAPAKPAAAAPAKPAAPSAPSPKAPAPPADEPASEDDAVHQTQTMRAISEAKSISDISDTMAETLFGDAELDFLSTSLGSAGNWTEPDAVRPPAKTPAPAPQAQQKPKPKPAKVPSNDDDLLDLLGLSDAPLELIDDSAQPPGDKTRRSGTQR